MLSILYEITLEKELQNSMTNNVFWDKQVIPQLQQNKKANKNPCQSQESKPGTLASQSDALPLEHN